MTTHVYCSTACLHDQHDQCRMTCKFCQVGCVCRCHKTANGDRAVRNQGGTG